MTDPIGTAQERELIETVARAICEASGKGKPDDMMGVLFGFGGLPNTPTPPYRWQQHVAQARAAIDALQSRIAEVGRLTELIEELVSKAYERGWNEGCETMLDANEIDGAIMYPHKDARNEGCGTYMNELRAALSLQRRV